MPTSTPAYSVGTVALTNGGSMATFSGTSMLANARVNDTLFVQGGQAMTVTAVVSDTELTVFPGWSGTTGSGKTYKLVRGFDWAQVATLAAQLVGVVGQLDKGLPYTPLGQGILSERPATPPDGYRFFTVFEADEEDRLLYFYSTVHGWSAGVDYKGPAGPPGDSIAGPPGDLTLEAQELYDEMIVLRDDTEDFAADAALSEDNAGDSETAAAASASTATTQAGISTTKAGEAAASATTATGAATTATTQAGIATTQAGISTTKAGEAADSATDADLSATAAADSEEAAEGFEIAAGEHADAAEGFADAASGFADDAEAEKILAVAAKDASVAAKDTAVAAKDTSVAAADTSTTQAGISTTQAGISTTKAGEAAGYADDASDFAADAALAKDGAEAAEDAAAAILAAVRLVGAVFEYSDINTDADPGAGKLRFSHDDLSAATHAYFDNTAVGGTDISAWLDSWDDAANAISRGTLTLRKADESANVWVVFRVIGTVVDGTGYRKVPVSYAAGATGLLDTDDFVVEFAPAGNDGSGTGDYTIATNTADDITETGTRVFVSPAQRTSIGDIAGIKTKTDWITVTQAVDLDAIETNSAASKVKTDYITISQAVDLDAIEIDVAASKAKTDWITITQAVDLDTLESSFASVKTKVDFLTVTASVDLDDLKAKVNGLDQAVVLKGSWNANAGTFPGGGTAQAGWAYIVGTGGTVDGQTFTNGDRVIAITDNASTTVFASNWFKEDYTDAVLSVVGLTGAVTAANIKSALSLSLADISDATDKVDVGGDTMGGALNWATAASIASGSTTALGGTASNRVVITGTTTITAFGSTSNGVARWCRVATGFTITNNANIICPGGANIAAAAGDTFLAVSEGSNVWRIDYYQRASGLPIVNPTVSVTLANITDASADGRSLVAANYATMRSLMGAQEGSTKLANLDSLTWANNTALQFTGSSTVSTYSLTTAGKALLDDADASAQRTTLGLGNIATAAVTVSTSSPSGGSNGDIWFKV